MSKAMKNEPIRVLMVIGCMNFGGAETMVMNLYRCMDREKVQFDFLVHKGVFGAYEEEIRALGGKIYRIDKYNGKNYFSYVKQLKSHFSAHPEHKIVHCHMARTAPVCLKIAKKYGAYAIFHSHSTKDTRKKLYSLCCFLYSLPTRFIADHFFACSPEAAVAWFGKKIASSSQCDIIYNGIDCERFSFNPKARDEIRVKYDLQDHLVIGHVGRHTPAKNPLFMLEVFARVYQKYTNARLLQVGQGELTQQMKQRCRELGIQSAVIFAGAQRDVEKYYSAMDVFLFPSLWEGLGMVVVEAQTSGLHCLVSKEIPTLADIKAGLFHGFDLQRSAEEWATMALSFKSSERSDKTAEYTRRAGYDINDTAKHLSKFYYSLIDQKK